MLDLKTMTLERRGHAAILTLRRPEVRNAISPEVATEIETCLDAVDEAGASGDDARRIRALILSGEGAVFCAGADLGYLSGLEDREEGLLFCRRMNDLLDRLHKSRFPVIAALDGNVLGGGCELILAAHLRFAAEGVTFSFRHAAMGLITGWGGGARLLDLVGRSTALHWQLTAATVDAERAEQCGLINAAVPGSALEAALEATERMTRLSSVSVEAFLDLSRDPDREADLFTRCWRGEDFPQRLDVWRRRRKG